MICSLLWFSGHDLGGPFQLLQRGLPRWAARGHLRRMRRAQDGTPFRQRVHIIVEVAVIALVTALTSYPLTFTRGLSTITIRCARARARERMADGREGALRKLAAGGCQTLCPTAGSAQDGGLQNAIGGVVKRERKLGLF